MHTLEREYVKWFCYQPKNQQEHGERLSMLRELVHRMLLG